MTDEELVSELCLGFLQLAYDRAQPLIPSKTLQESLTIAANVTPGEGYLEVPHYWAQYVHDGRGGMIGSQVSESGVLIWFKNINDDPRIAPGQTPERVQDLRHLTSAEMAQGLAANRAAYRDGLDKRDWPMQVRRIVFKGVEGSFFFDPQIGMSDMMEQYDAFADKVFAKFIRSQIPWAFKVKTVPIHVLL